MDREGNEWGICNSGRRVGEIESADGHTERDGGTYVSAGQRMQAKGDTGMSNVARRGESPRTLPMESEATHLTRLAVQLLPSVNRSMVTAYPPPPASGPVPAPGPFSSQT